MQDVLFQFLLRMGDNTLILGHRLSEWCGHAPVLEEDIAVANTALDLIGQTQMWLGLAGETEGQGRDADQLAYHRDAWDFKNFLLLELPNGDFGQTIMRQFLFDVWHVITLNNLSSSKNNRVAEIAEKSVKEATYHLDRSSDTVIGLGDGTSESHNRMQNALNYCWPYVGEMFDADKIDNKLAKAKIAPDPKSLRIEFDKKVTQVFKEATLSTPESTFFHTGGKSGTNHTENLGHILAEMQWLQRVYPDATW